MRILVSGDRHYQRPHLVDWLLDVSLACVGPDEEFVVIEGQCPYGGADRFAERWAKAQRPRVGHLPFPADWTRYGRRAGPIRNSEMLKKSSPTHVACFHDNLPSSSGTKHMLSIARRAPGVVVWHVAVTPDGQVRINAFPPPPVQGTLLAM
jgi:hypothetical protein